MRQQWRCDDGGVLDVPARAVPAVEHQSAAARHEQHMALSARLQQQPPKEQTPDERHEEAQADSRHGESDRKRRATSTDATTTDHLPQAKHARTGPTHAQEAQEVSSAAGERCDATQEHSSSPRKKRSLDQWSLHSGIGSEFVGSTAAHHGAAAAAAGPSSPHEQREQREAAAASACTLAASRRTSTRDSKLVCHQGTGVKTHARTYTCARGAYKKVSTDVCDPRTSDTGAETATNTGRRTDAHLVFGESARELYEDTVGRWHTRPRFGDRWVTPCVVGGVGCGAGGGASWRARARGGWGDVE